MNHRQRGDDGIGFHAFVQLYQADYLLYAQARLGDPLASRTAVEQALRRTEQGWSLVLRRRRPNACAWRILRATVDVACCVSSRPAPDLLRRGLPEAKADAALLHHRLGMPVGRAAALMGVEASTVRADLLMVQRLLGWAPEVILEEERRSTR